MGRAIEIEHLAGSAISSTITYNKLGQVASRTDLGGNTVSYEYDHMGRTVKVTDAVGDVEYAYNSLGELVTVTDSLGQVTTNTYDTAFRLTKVTDDIGKETHYTYDAYGPAGFGGVWLQHVHGELSKRPVKRVFRRGSMRVFNPSVGNQARDIAVGVGGDTPAEAAVAGDGAACALP